MNVSRQTHDQVVAVLDRLIDAARQGDEDALARLAAPECTGFGRDRLVLGPAGLGVALAGWHALEEVEVRCEGTIAWVTARLISADMPGTPGRFTAVLRGTGHAWLVAQVHASLPAPTRPDPVPHGEGQYH